MLFPLFVYGTLKQGLSNHHLVKPYLSDIFPGKIRGVLYDLSDGYPVAELPPDTHLASGSADIVYDLALSQAYPGNMLSTHKDEATSGYIHGEILYLKQPSLAMPAIDELEDYFPGAESLYERVLVTAFRTDNDSFIPVWSYAGSTALIKRGQRLVGGHWSER